MYNIECRYNGSWHVIDTAQHYHDAVPLIKMYRESMGDDVPMTIEPHDENIERECSYAL